MSALDGAQKLINEQKREEERVRKRAEFAEKKRQEELEFERELEERVGTRLFRYWKGLDPLRRKQQLEDWDRDAEVIRKKEEEERKELEAQLELERRTHVYPSGAKYIGDSIKDPDGGTVTPHGMGKYWWPDGKLLYEGRWFKGNKEGHGTYHWLNGTSWSGMFRGDNMHGYGIFVTKDGKERPCMYQDGRRTGWIEEMALGARIEIQTTGTQWISATIIKEFPGSKRLVKYDRKDPTEELVDFSTRRFRFHRVRQANTYRMTDIANADASKKWSTLAVREPITMTPRAVKLEREAAALAAMEDSSVDESIAPSTARTEDSMFY